MTFFKHFVALAFIALGFLAFPAGAQQEPWFSVDAPLNAGLGTPPGTVDRRTPRAALESFLVAAEEEDWTAAAHILDLGDIAVGAQTDEGAALARQLHSVLDRKALLDWGTIIGRPDALQTTGGQQDAMAGSPRRSLLIRELSLSPVPGSIRLNRLKPGDDADPVWLFSRETVADISAMYQEYGPSRLEAWLPANLRADAVWGLMWWEIIGLPLLIVSAAVFAWLLHRALGAVARRADNPYLQGIVSACSVPVMIAAVTGLVWVVSRNVFVFSGAIDIIIAPIIAIGFVSAALLLVVNVAEALLDNVIAPGEDIDLTMAERDEARAIATKLNAAKRILVIFVFLLGAGVILSTADIFRSLGISLLASAGALTLVLGFAARDVLGNVMASLQIALNQSARVGDRVVFKDELCHVERIQLTFVQLRNWDGTRVIVPVEQFVSETFSNWSIQEPAMLRILKFKLHPKTDVDALRQAFLGILNEMSEGALGEALGDLSKASVNVAGQDVFGIDVWFSVPCADPNTSWDVACAVREDLVRAVNAIAERTGGPIFAEAAAAEAA